MIWTICLISVSCHLWYLVRVFFRGWVGDQLRTKQFFFNLQYFSSADYGSGRCIRIIVSFLFIDVNIWTVQPRLPDALLNQIFTTFLQWRSSTEDLFWSLLNSFDKWNMAVSYLIVFATLDFPLFPSNDQDISSLSV